MSGEAPVVTCPRCRATYPTGRFGLCPRCLLGDEGPLAASPPRSLGDALELLEEIGRGGMGTVYRGRDRRLDRTVAVKLLAEHLADDPDFRRRFDREARALARLSHPSVVGIYGVGEADGRPYIVMEHVAGPPLSAHLPLPIDRAVEVALDVAAALAYAHGQGIVHRDIKPQNVLLGPDGRAKVTDFGIARLLANDDTSWTITGPGEALGTPRFAAPEALRGAEADPRQDVYSLGALLYAMVRGEAPVGEFEALPGGLDRIVRRALSTDPLRRYPTIDEMRRDLAGLRTAGEADADADALSIDEKNWPRAVALLLAVATAGWLWALLVSLTPRVVDPREMGPLVMVAPEPLPDGRVVTWARFETGPILGAAGLSVLALAGYGLLRRHWRHAGLEVRRPERPLPQTRAVLLLGALSVGLYAIRKIVQLIAHASFVPYVPVVGGLIELAVLVFVWSSILEAWRTSRSLTREPLLWLGFALALVPPVLDFLLYLRAWRP